MNHILAEIDIQIDRLTQVRNLLAGTFDGPAYTPKRGPGRPLKSSNVISLVTSGSPSPISSNSKTTGIWQSNEFKEKMRRITKANWKKRRAAEKKAAKAA